jgi:hypothetical protein
MMIKPSSLRLARKLQTGEEAFDRLNPTFSVPPTAPTASATTTTGLLPAQAG